MPTTAKILTLISPAIGVIILSAAIAGIQPSHSTPPPVQAQPTEWWALEHQPGKDDLQLSTCGHDPDLSPASYYEFSASLGYKPHLTEKGTAIVITENEGEGLQFYWFRSKAACESAIKSAKEAAEKAAQAEQRKLDQFLAPYR